MRCKHCGEESPEQFCCSGCKAAYSLINSFDLENFYKLCKNIYNVTPLKIVEIKNSLTYLEFVTSEEKHHEINLIVEGIYCGSCIWLIENVLHKQHGVTQARINLSTKRLSLKWQGKLSQIKNYIKTIEKLGYRLIPYTPDNLEHKKQHEENNLLKGIFISSLATTSIMMLTFGVWIGNSTDEMTNHFRTILHFIAAFIAIPATIYSGIPFYRSALNALKAKRTNMDVPISVGVLSALIISILQTFFEEKYAYYDAPVTLIFFLLLGRYLDIKMRNRARSSISNLILAQASTVNIATANEIILLPLKKAKVGDIMFVAAGDKIPADGTITKGTSEIDLSLITGESIPQAVNAGSKVIAGCMNLESPLYIKITALGDKTQLAEIIKLVENAEQGKAKYVRIADRIASYYTPIVLALSLVTLSLWLMNGSTFIHAIQHAISVLIITCPCALGLAVPTVQVIASSHLFSKGILVKIGDAYEKLSQIDTIIFDKTGTLTSGKPSLTNANLIDQTTLAIAAKIASHSNHPLCVALSNACIHNIVGKLSVEEVKGHGLKALYNGKIYMLGSKRFCNVQQENLDNYSEIWLRETNNPAVRFTFQDTVKPDAKLMIEWCQKSNLDLYIASGDRYSAVLDVAKHLKIKNFISEVTPKNKYEFINKLTANNKKILMIGDGINDTPSLKAAFISMAPSTGAEVTQNYADIVFNGSKLNLIVQSIKLARFSQKLIKQNFLISFIYNILTIPIAMMGFATPIFAAIVMSLSSIMVVLNSLRIKE